MNLQTKTKRIFCLALTALLLGAFLILPAAAETVTYDMNISYSGVSGIGSEYGMYGGIWSDKHILSSTEVTDNGDGTADIAFHMNTTNGIGYLLVSNVASLTVKETAGRTVTDSTTCPYVVNDTIVVNKGAYSFTLDSIPEDTHYVYVRDGRYFGACTIVLTVQYNEAAPEPEPEPEPGGTVVVNFDVFALLLAIVAGALIIVGFLVL